MNVKQTFIRLLLWVLLLALGACSLIPVRTLWALRRFDINELDGSQLRALVYLPADVGTQRDALKVHLRVERGEARGGEALDESLALRPVSGAMAAHKLAPPWPGGQWVALALDEGEQRRLAAVRDHVAKWKAADGPDAKRRLSLDATPQFCAKTAGLTAAQVRLSLWLRWKAGQDELQMLDGATLKDVDDGKAEDQGLPVCVGS